MVRVQQLSELEEVYLQSLFCWIGVLMHLPSELWSSFEYIYVLTYYRSLIIVRFQWETLLQKEGEPWFVTCGQSEYREQNVMWRWDLFSSFYFWPNGVWVIRARWFIYQIMRLWKVEYPTKEKIRCRESRRKKLQVNPYASLLSTNDPSKPRFHMLHQVVQIFKNCCPANVKMLETSTSIKLSEPSPFWHL